MLKSRTTYTVDVYYGPEAVVDMKRIGTYRFEFVARLVAWYHFHVKKVGMTAITGYHGLD